MLPEVEEHTGISKTGRAGPNWFLLSFKSTLSP